MYEQFCYCRLREQCDFLNQENCKKMLHFCRYIAHSFSREGVILRVLRVPCGGVGQVNRACRKKNGIPLLEHKSADPTSAV